MPRGGRLREPLARVVLTGSTEDPIPQLPCPGARCTATKDQILIVDDDPETRRQLCWALAEDFDIQLAASLGEAVEALQGEELPCAALVDLHLPPDPSTIDGGLSVIRRLRETSRKTRIIVLSADETAEARRRSRRAGAREFLSKPVDRSRVLRALRE